MATRSPRTGETYRGARRNRSGAQPTKSLVSIDSIKHRPVPFRPYKRKAEREAARDARRAYLALIRKNVQQLPTLPSFGKSLPGTGGVVIGEFSGLRKRMRAIRRGLLTAGVVADEKSLMRHSWYRRKVRNAA